MRQGKIPRNGHQRARVLVSPRQWYRTEQRLCIGMLHLVEYVVDRATLNRLTRIHDAQPIAGFQNQTKVVRNKQHRCAVFLPRSLTNSTTAASTVTSNAVVGSSRISNAGFDISAIAITIRAADHPTTDAGSCSISARGRADVRP